MHQSINHWRRPSILLLASAAWIDALDFGLSGLDLARQSPPTQLGPFNDPGSRHAILAGPPARLRRPQTASERPAAAD